jgi:hypothetical protein
MPGKRQALRRAPAASGRIASAVSFAPFDPPAVDNQAWLSYADLWVKNRARPGHHIFIKGAEKPWAPTELVCGLKPTPATEENPQRA